MEENGTISCHFAIKVSSTDTSMLKKKPEEKNSMPNHLLLRIASLQINMILFPDHLSLPPNNSTFYK